MTVRELIQAILDWLSKGWDRISAVPGNAWEAFLNADITTIGLIMLVIIGIVLVFKVVGSIDALISQYYWPTGDVWVVLFFISIQPLIFSGLASAGFSFAGVTIIVLFLVADYFSLRGLYKRFLKLKSENSPLRQKCYPSCYPRPKRPTP